MGRASGGRCAEWMAELVVYIGSGCIHLLQEVDFISEAQIPASHVFHKHSDCNARAGILLPSYLAGQIKTSSKHVSSLASDVFAYSWDLGGEKCRWGCCSLYHRDSFKTDEDFLRSIQQLRAHLTWLHTEKAKFVVVGCDAQKQLPANCGVFTGEGVYKHVAGDSSVRSNLIMDLLVELATIAISTY